VTPAARRRTGSTRGAAHREEGPAAAEAPGARRHVLCSTTGKLRDLLEGDGKRRAALSTVDRGGRKQRKPEAAYRADKGAATAWTRGKEGAPFIVAHNKGQNGVTACTWVRQSGAAPSARVRAEGRADSERCQRRCQRPTSSMKATRVRREEVEGTAAQRWPRGGTRAPSGGKAAGLRAHEEKLDGARDAARQATSSGGLLRPACRQAPCCRALGSGRRWWRL
jgi:hypothetical protein